MKKGIIAIGIVVVLICIGGLAYFWGKSSQEKEQALVKQYFTFISKDQRDEVKQFIKENPSLINRKQENETALDYALELQRYSIAVDLIDGKVQTTKPAMLQVAYSLLDYSHLQYDMSKEQKERETVFKAMKYEKVGNINAQDDYGNTALHIAASKGDIEITKWLLQNGADTSIKNDDQQTALAVATIKGSLDCMLAIADKNPTLIKELDKEQKTILHLAVENMHIDLYEHILSEFPQSLMMKDKDRQTPMDIAVNYKDNESIRYLKSYLAKH